MSQLHPVNQALLTVLDNQVTRTVAAFEGLTDADLDAPPGGDCHSIREIAKHLLGLRQFQLKLLGSPLAADVPQMAEPVSLSELMDKLTAAVGLVRRGIQEHDAEDWFAVPGTPREGPWGEEATLARLVRPLNDFTTHLGALRAIRRIRGNPATRTQ